MSINVYPYGFYSISSHFIVQTVSSIYASSRAECPLSILSSVHRASSPGLL